MELITPLICTLIYLIILFRCFKFGVFSPPFLFFLHLLLGVPVRYLFLLLTDNYQRGVLHPIVTLDVATLFEILIFSLISYITFELISHRYRISLAFINTNISNRWFSVRLEVNEKKFYLLSGLFFLFISIYLFIMLSVAGGFSALLHMFTVRVSSQMAGLGYVGILSDIAILCSIALFAIYRYRSYKGVKKALSLFIVLLCFCLLIMQGGRGNIIMYLMSIMICSTLVKGSKNIKLKSSLIILTIVFATTIIGLSSRIASQQGIEFKEGLNRVNSELTLALSAPFAIYDHFYLSKVYAERHGYDYGVFYLENLVRPIPRSLWKEKPEVLGKKIRLEFYGDDQGGIPPGLIGESYISFGVFGFLIVGIVAGFILSFLQHIFLLSQLHKNYIVFTSIFVPYFTFNLVRGGFDVGFTRLVIFGVMIFLLRFFLKYRVKFN